MTEFQFGLLEELFPADALDPLAYTLVTIGVAGVKIHNPFYGLDRSRPAWWLVGDVRHGQLGKRGNGASVGDLAAHP